MSTPSNPPSVGQTHFYKGSALNDFGVIGIVTSDALLTRYVRNGEERRIPTGILVHGLSEGRKLAKRVVAELIALGLGSEHWTTILDKAEMPVRRFPQSPSQVPIRHVHVARLEGGDESLECTTFGDANAFLQRLALSVPASGGYDHVAYELTWSDDLVRSGEIELTHAHATIPSPLSNDLLSMFLYQSGQWLPFSMLPPAQYLTQIAPHRQAALTFLEGHALTEQT